MRRLFFLLLFAMSLAAYTDRSFSMEVQLQPDGSAHVIEKSFFVLENKNEIEAFDFVLRQGKTTLADYQKFSRNIRYHVLGSVLTVRLVAAREFSLGFTTSSVTLEYDVFNLSVLNVTSSRRTHYRVLMDKFLLGSSPGDLTLGNNFRLALNFPSDSVKVQVSPDAGAIREAGRVEWVGPTSGHWDVSFDREITLAQEVQLFFIQLYGLLFSPYLLWLLLAVIVAVAGYKVFKTRDH